MKDKKYRSEVDSIQPVKPGVIKPGGRPSGPRLRKGYATLPVDRPGKPSDVDSIQPVRPGARPGLPMPKPAQRNAAIEALKKAQEKMAMEAARKKSGK
jgi:hypothetical protein